MLETTVFIWIGWEINADPKELQGLKLNLDSRLNFTDLMTIMPAG